MINGVIYYILQFFLQIRRVPFFSDVKICAMWPWASVMSFASRSDPRGPIFLFGVRFAPKGRFGPIWASLSIGQFG